MSAQRRTKKSGLFSRLLCCLAPDPQADSSAAPARSQNQQQAEQSVRDDRVTTGLPATQTLTQQRPPETSHSADRGGFEAVQAPDKPTAIDTDVDGTAPSKMPSLATGTDLADSKSPVSDLAPALERQELASIAVDRDESHPLAPAPLPEEKAALADDEPLTPSSAVIAATVPIADVTDDTSTVPPQVGGGPSSQQSKWLLPALAPVHQGKKCLVLDLDETLVHSSFKIIHQADFVVPVEIDGIFHNVYVIKRPGVDDFMKQMGEHFEVVVFTASLAKYADPVLDVLDIHKVVHHRLFRESCHNHMGNYVKDLSQLGRDLRDAIIIDNSPASYVFHPAHAVPVSSWFNDVHDTELTHLVPFLLDLTTVEDVSQVLELCI